MCECRDVNIRAYLRYNLDAIFNCDKCDKKYQWKESLTRHQKHDHGDFFQKQENAAKKDFLSMKDALALSEKKVVYSLGDEDLVIRATDNFKVNALALSDGRPVFNAWRNTTEL